MPGKSKRPVRRGTGPKRAPSKRALKSLERAWRRFWIADITALLRAATPRGAGAAWPWEPRPRRILFLRHDRIGDMIVSTGLIRAIARSHPGVVVDVLASPANAPVVRGDPAVGRVVVFDRSRPSRFAGLARRLRAARYDAVVDCMPTAPSLTTLLLMLASGARHRIGVAGRGNDDALTVAVPPRPGARHIIDHLSALAAPFGVDVGATDFSPVLVLDADERAVADGLWRSRAGPGASRGRRLLVNVSAGKTARRWPDERFVEVLAGVRRRLPDVGTLVIGGPAERARAAAIAHAAGAGLAEPADIRSAFALVATADALLTPDTGIGHAACALRTPAVVMFLRDKATLWGLYGTPGHSLESADGTLASLPVEPVLAALTDVLRPSAAALADVAADDGRVAARVDTASEQRR
ncbi:MAG: glycosyltransferase family 9 protein [Gemmatimonadaceae bacterium]